VLCANDSDEKLRRLARLTLTAMQLPEDRLPVLERDSHSLRQIARERLGWCRHIDLLQDLSHTLHRSTCYVTDPPRSCFCKLHGHKSYIQHPEAEVVIQAFKRAYCDGCPDHSPKVSQVP
jgi:hypothetical protein